MRFLTLAVCCSFLFVVGCTQNENESKGNKQAQGASDSQPPPKAVTVMSVVAKDIDTAPEIPGRVRALNTAEIRPQVSGIIQSLFFKQGSFVEEGQQLYQIDDASYQAEYDSALANLNNRLADLELADALQKRYQSLIETDAISEQEFDEAKAQVAKAQAAVALARAEVQTTSVNLSYTKIHAPISGYIGPSLVTQGALVTAQQAEPLATVRQLNPVYVDLSQAASNIMQIQQQIAATQANKKNTSAFEINLLLDDQGSLYPHKGKLFATDLAVDESTGTIRLRTTFPNPDRQLIPGMFVRATIENTKAGESIIVPQKSVTIEPDGSKSVWLVNEQNMTVKRNITTSGTYENQWIIESGIEVGDKIIVEGLMMLKNDMKVKPTLVKDNS